MAEPPRVEPQPNPEAAPAAPEAGAALQRTAPTQARAAGGLLGTLDALRKHTGDAIGELYARTARTLLKRLETIQDREALRRFHRHDERASSSSATPASPGATSAVVSPPSTPQTSA